MQIFTDDVLNSKCHFRKMLYLLMETEMFHFLASQNQLVLQTGQSVGGLLL